MIASIKGRISQKSATEIIVDVNGIGYRLFVPLSTFYVLPDIGELISLNVYTHVKEDAFQLFGFSTTEEKKIFQLMISVSGIGPRLALNILSGISARDLAEALAGGDLTKLTHIPGIGKKMAERLVFELKTKVTELLEISPIAGEGVICWNEAIRDDALSALVNLGYKNSIAKQAIEKASKENLPDLTLEELLKRALKELGN